MAKCLSLRRYIAHQLLGAVVVNATITGLLTWWLTKTETVALWGEKGVAIETLLAALGVTLLTVLLATPAVRREARLGKVKALPWTASSHGFLRLSTHHTWGRALLFSLLAAAVFALPAVLAWSLLGFNEISYQTFLVYKIFFVVAVGCVITPLNILWVLTDRRTHAVQTGVPV